MVSSGYPPKTFDYKGEDIIIYPMADGDFLACYLTEDFLVLSCQKKLIEEVIDIRKTGKSLAADSAFKEVRAAEEKSDCCYRLHSSGRNDGMDGV